MTGALLTTQPLTLPLVLIVSGRPRLCQGGREAFLSPGVFPLHGMFGFGPVVRQGALHKINHLGH